MIFLTLKFPTALDLLKMFNNRGRTPTLEPVCGELKTKLNAMRNGDCSLILCLSPESAAALRCNLAGMTPEDSNEYRARAAVLLMLGHANDVPGPAPYDPDHPNCV